MDVLNSKSEAVVSFFTGMDEMTDLIGRVLKNRTPHLNGEKFLTGKDVCAMLHISPRTLQEWRSKQVIVNAKTRSGEKAALQLYLEKIKPEWIVKAEQIKELFSFREKAVIVEKQVTDKIDFEKIKKAATKSWNPEMQKIELTSFLNSMILYIKGFNLKHYGYSTIEKFSEDYGFTVERTDNVGKIYLIPQFDFEKPTEIKKREIKPIPFDEAMSAFHKCKKGNGGLVHTKVYYIQLCKEIRGFKPEDYGGRFNEFYRNMGVFDVVEIAKDNKFLKLKGE